jgi:hypothetical protein
MPMLGLVGLALMIALTVLYHGELGWGTIILGWVAVIGAGLLVLVLPGLVVMLIQSAIITVLYMKANA